MRDGPKYVTGKESLGWPDDPALAFTTPAPAVFSAGSAAADLGADCDWNTVRAALAIIGAAPVARRMKLDPRSVRYWLDGSGKPKSAGDVEKAVVACAAEAGLSLPSDGGLNHLGEVCARLPERAAIQQRFLGAAIEYFARSHGSTRELGRAMGLAESTLRDWRELGSAAGNRPISQIHAIAAKLAKFARAEIRRARRRFSFDPGPIGELQRIHVALSLSSGDTRPAVLPPERLYPAMAEMGARVERGEVDPRMSRFCCATFVAPL